MEKAAVRGLGRLAGSRLCADYPAPGLNASPGVFAGRYDDCILIRQKRTGGGSWMSQTPEIKSRLGAILRSTSGNFLEQFDFFLFGFYASDISKAFFPTGNPVTA
jgi:hypothetical protein